MCFWQDFERHWNFWMSEVSLGSSFHPVEKQRSNDVKRQWSPESAKDVLAQFPNHLLLILCNLIYSTIVFQSAIHQDDGIENIRGPKHLSAKQTSQNKATYPKINKLTTTTPTKTLVKSGYKDRFQKKKRSKKKKWDKHSLYENIFTWLLHTFPVGMSLLLFFWKVAGT